MRIQVFGASGMLGSEIVRGLSRDPLLQVQGVMRRTGEAAPESGPESSELRRSSLVGGLDISSTPAVMRLIESFRPDVIINCAGWRQIPHSAPDMAAMIEVNSRWPHQLAAAAGSYGARFVHFSSDAVFSGKTGHYAETDQPDPIESYGVSKLLGEPAYPNCVTLRTSMIGHEHPPGTQLVDWFLRQTGKVNGYAGAVFSGLPTNEIAHVVRTILLPRHEMSGVWHLAAKPITKLALLTEIARHYGVDAELTSVATPKIDRSLDSSKFSAATGYVAPPWPQLIERMLASRPLPLGNA